MIETKLSIISTLHFNFFYLHWVKKAGFDEWKIHKTDTRIKIQDEKRSRWCPSDYIYQQQQKGFKLHKLFFQYKGK